MKKLWIIVLVGVLVVGGSGCQRKKEVKARPTVALVMKTLNNPFFIDMQKGAEEAAKRLGVNVVFQAPERDMDVEKQMQIIENLIQTKVDVLCIVPCGSKEIVPVVVKANKVNIPVIAVDTKIDESTVREAGARVLSYIGSDNVEGGRIAGEYIISRLKGKGKIAILEGIPGHETADARLRGFHQTIDKISGIEVVASQTANWERSQGFTVFQNILQAHPEVQAVFACNDMMALGAVEAIAAAGRSGEIIVVGFDAIEDARAAIKEGKMEGSIAQYPSEMGRLAVEKSLDLLKSNPIPSYIPTRVELITKDKF